MEYSFTRRDRSSFSLTVCSCSQLTARWGERRQTRRHTYLPAPHAHDPGDDEHQEEAPDLARAGVQEDHERPGRVADVGVLLPVRQGLHGPHDVHAGPEGGPKVEQDPQGPPDLHPERPADDVVGPPRLDGPVGRDGAEAEGGEEGGEDARAHDEGGPHGPGLAGDGGEAEEEDDAHDLGEAGQEDAGVGVQLLLGGRGVAPRAALLPPPAPAAARAPPAAAAPFEEGVGGQGAVNGGEALAGGAALERLGVLVVGGRRPIAHVGQGPAGRGE